MAYVKRPIPRDNNGNIQPSDLRRPEAFNPGAVLMLRTRPHVLATEKDISSRAFSSGGSYDVKDVEVSYDGRFFIFAMRAPELPNTAPEDQPKWNIWEYDAAKDSLTRVITDNVIAEDGHDVAPYYLPSNEVDPVTQEKIRKIVFSSTRQERSKGILIDEGKGQFAAVDEDRLTEAFVLHTMTIGVDGSAKQISFNQSHDLDPSVLQSGEILFSRWDGAGSNNTINLYTIRPDGTGLSLYYGRHSRNTGPNNSTVQFIQPRETFDGRIIAVLREFQSDQFGGSAHYIDSKNYTDVFQQNGVGVVTNSAQDAMRANMRTDNRPSIGGRFSSIYQAFNSQANTYVAWSPCNMLQGGITVGCPANVDSDPNAVAGEPAYGVWKMEADGVTFSIIALQNAGSMYTDIAVAHERAQPLVLSPVPTNASGVGVLNIRSVYDIGGAFNDRDAGTPDKAIPALADPAQTLADARSARFLRVEKAVSIPSRDIRNFQNSAFGPQQNQRMREIVGYAPIEPDGSVTVEVPADIPIAISVLDKDGRRIGGRHQNWIQVRAGETRNCNGCHTSASEVAHGRSDAEFPALNTGSLGATAFPNTVATYLPNAAGKTMAETRADRGADAGCITDCEPTTLSLDLVYADIWTDPAVRVPDTAFSYTYAGLTTARPDRNCTPSWNTRCRVVINYETHIHPIWSVVRPNPADTCIACHTNVDVANANADRVPDAQLDLTNDGPNDNGPRFKAYNELMFTDQVQVLDGGGALVDADPAVNVAPSMSGAGANASSRFFSVFDPGGTHAGRLTAHELRLISEWLDIGAQYYNDPFLAPLN